jgi:prepilin peptidase CpaA
LVLSGWLLGLVHDFGGLLGTTGDGGIGASLAGTALGFALLFPVYAIGGMGAGDVKMQMGFGAWIGAFYGFGQTGAPGVLGVIFWAFCLGAVIGGVLAIGMIVIRGQYRRNLANTQVILGDLFTSSSVGDVADKASRRKPTMHLLPYGIPLCLGFVSYLIILNGVG